jgi:co-chaperonin GroES (HSP10)
MAINLDTIIGTLTPVGKRVLVSNMYFGEQKTKSGLIIRDDDGTTRGIYPRWGQVHSIGPDNNDGLNIGDWVLIEHGRWTRSVKIDEGNGEIELRMIDEDAILGVSDTKPDEVFIGSEYSDGEAATVDPGSFVKV